MTDPLLGLKARMKATWMAGDFGEVAKFNQPAADAFVARRGITGGMRVLDVACGSGNLAIPAARAGGRVTGVDIAPNLLEEARARATRDGLAIAFEEGDAEQLAYGDGAFDLVMSMYGAMFAPRPERVASELVRVCRAGGEIAMANWTARGFVGQMFKTSSAHVAPPAGIAPPILWGDEATVRERFRAVGVTAVRVTPVMAQMRYPFAAREMVEFFRTYFGPTQMAFAALDAAGQDALRQDLERLWAAHNLSTDGGTHIDAEYLEVVATV
ncbi:MAG TPA: methyltransferase domain-containing protein [Gemmatimonadaceae bacterium]|jgi:ubiquinone/menaquinone biosynthesis C-methylase UbiE|nr:methyltransferase domain-containing protein [Gemmatimonadaceae bacterium]